MADEIKKDEEKEFHEFDDSTEPIDSIEKTVADLKRKIQELSSEDEQKEEDKNSEEQFSIPKFIAPHAETLQQMKDTTIKTVNKIKDVAVDTTKQAASVVKEQTEKLNENENIRNTIDYIKKNATKAYDTALIKLDEIKQDPKVQEVSTKAEDMYTQAKDYIVPKSKEFVDVVKDKTKQTVNKLNDFVNRPDVQDTIQKVKDTTKEVVDKGIQTVNDVIRSKDKKQEVVR